MTDLGSELQVPLNSDEVLIVIQVKDVIRIFNYSLADETIHLNSHLNLNYNCRLNLYHTTFQIQIQFWLYWSKFPGTLWSSCISSLGAPGQRTHHPVSISTITIYVTLMRFHVFTFYHIIVYIVIIFIWWEYPYHDDQHQGAITAISLSSYDDNILATAGEVTVIVHNHPD